LYKKGFADLYQSLSLAFSALPDIISHLTESKRKLNKPPVLKLNLFKQAETLLLIFEKEHLSKPQIVIITGELHEGKTTYAKRIIDKLQNQDFKIGGFLSLGLQEDGDRTGFDLFDIETKQKVVLCRKTQNNDWLKYGHYYFDPDGLSKGNEILSIIRLSDKQAVIIDEIGPLELGDQGWCESIENICLNSSIPQIWIVRKSLVPKVIKKWNVGNIYICKISEDSIADVQELLIGIINSQGKKYEIN
jgi:iron complex transport system ATP-binding protein